MVEVEELAGHDVLNLLVDPSTGGISKVSLPFVAVEFEADGTADWKRTERRDDQLVETDGTRSDDRTFNFAVQPLVDDLEGCDTVTGGDGIHSLSGGCSDTTVREHKTTTESYRWEITIQ